MNSLWYLVRLGDKDQNKIQLKIGENHIGRSSDADILVKSVFSSRAHCVILIDQNNKIILKDKQTSNGTYINSTVCKGAEKRLRLNDTLGIGCTGEYTEDPRYYVYQVLREGVYYDDSDDSSKTIKNEVDQIDTKIESAHLISDDEEIIITDNQNTIKKFKLNDDENSNDIFFSQSIISEYKDDDINNQLESISQYDLDINNDNITDDYKLNIKIEKSFQIEDIIYLSSDDDEAEEDKNKFATWLQKLSQNVDFKNSQQQEIQENKIENHIEDQIKVENEDVNEIEKEIKYHEEPNEILLQPDVSIIPLTLSILNNKSFETEKTLKTKRKRLIIISDSSSDDSNENNNYQEMPLVEKPIEVKKIKLIDPVPLMSRRKSVSSAVPPPVTSSTLTETKKRQLKIPTEFDIIKCQKRIINDEKKRLKIIDLKNKWREKPKYKIKNDTTKNLNDIKENRKLKLKEIAIAKQKTSTNDEPKIVNKPKVKLTIQNRGAFLTETIPVDIKKNKIIEKSNTDIIVGGIKHFLAKDIHKLPKIPKIIKEESSDQIINVQSSTIISKKRTSHVEVVTAGTSKIPSPHIRPPTVSAKLIETIFDQKSSTDLTSDFLGPISPKPSTSAALLPELLPIKIEKPLVSSITIKPQTCSNKIKLKSILKNTTSTQTIKKTVKFKFQPEIKIFQVENGRHLRKIDNNTIIPQTIAQFIKRKLSGNRDPNQHFGQNILTDILSWNPMWLYEKVGNDAPVNGCNHTLLPIVHAFNSIEDYQRIFLPLQKLEIWSQIYVDFHKEKKIKYTAILKHCSSAQRAQGMRNVYGCLVTLDQTNHRQLTAGNLILVEYILSGHFNICFGYITDARIYNNNQNNTNDRITEMYVIFESAQTHTTENIVVNMRVKLTIVSYIRVDVFGLNVIYDLHDSPLCNLILNPSSQPPKDLKVHSYRYKGADRLNKMQGDILMHIYNESLNRYKPSIVLVNGPPGTGKSCLISNLALQLLYGDEIKFLGLKILICAGSNQAIDIITEKLLNARKGANKFKLLRFGLLEKMNKSIQNVSLQRLVSRNNESDRIIQNLPTAEIKQNLRLMSVEKLFLEEKLKNLKITGAKTAVVLDEINSYEERLKRVNKIVNNNGNVSKVNIDERQISKKLMQNAQIVCTTLTSCINMIGNYNLTFDICIIDEATQCTEPVCLLPLQFQICTLVLVGDTQQLPATVISKTAKENGFCTSLFTRIQNNFSGTQQNPLKSLTQQYRMHPEICHFPNKYFYNNQLTTDESIIDINFLLQPYTVINLNFFQDHLNDTLNVSNKNEADFVVQLLLELINTVNCIQYSIGVITPYTAQKTKIENMISELSHPVINNVTVNTIDSYQGQERDIIILSTTRTDGFGFLGNNQRVNVALTRAKRCLIICGNFISLRVLPIWSSLLQDADERYRLFNINYLDDKIVKTAIQWIKK